MSPLYADDAMDILNLHFSEFDFDKPEETKKVIRAFFMANSDLDDNQTLNDLVDLVFLAYQQGHSAGYSEGSDYAAGYFDNGDDWDDES